MTPQVQSLAMERKENQEGDTAVQSHGTLLVSRAHGPFLPSLTITQDRHIFIVKAVVNTPAPAATLAQRRFLPVALHVIQENGSSALAKGEGPRHRQGQATAQLTAHHVGIYHVPVVVANAAPGAAVHDLQAPSAAAWAPYQPQLCKNTEASWRSGEPGAQTTGCHGRREATGTFYQTGVAGPCQLGNIREQMRGRGRTYLETAVAWAGGHWLEQTGQGVSLLGSGGLGSFHTPAPGVSRLLEVSFSRGLSPSSGATP